MLCCRTWILLYRIAKNLWIQFRRNSAEKRRPRKNKWSTTIHSKPHPTSATPRWMLKYTTLVTVPAANNFFCLICICQLIIRDRYWTEFHQRYSFSFNTNSVSKYQFLNTSINQISLLLVNSRILFFTLLIFRVEAISWK